MAWPETRQKLNGFLHIDQGEVPASPEDGDVWMTTAGLFARVNGVTVGPFATVSGSGSGAHPWWWAPPLAADFTAASFDGTTPTISDDSDIGLVLDNGANIVTGNVNRYAYKAAPASSADWSVVARVVRSSPFISYNAAGLIAVESSTGKTLLLAGFTNNDSGSSNAFSLYRRMTNTTVNADLGIWQGGFPHEAFYRLRYLHSGTTFIGELSMDGKNWTELQRVSKATAFTSEPNRVGIVFHNNFSGSGVKGYAACDRWVQSW